MNWEAWFWYLLGLLLFGGQQAGRALGWLPSFDFVLPLILWQVYWRSLNRFLIVFALVWGLVVDTFSSLLPGPAVLSYLFTIFFLHYLKGRFTPWSSATRILSFSLAFLGAELLRLYVLPVVLDLPLPQDMLCIVFEISLQALFWGAILEGLSQSAATRGFFALK